jgi:prephenate dehydrogenase
MSSTPVIGLVGSQGAYGRWLRRFFEQRMGSTVIGFDPADPAGESLDRLLEDADVLLFTAPIRHTVSIIDDCVARSAGRERGRLWLDVTSIKQAPMAAMCRSQAEVVGLHPMTAPPKSPTLKGRVLVVCEARLDRWRGWLDDLLAAFEAETVRVSAEHHDRAMTLVQAMVHATHLAQAGVVRGFAESLGPPASLLPMRTASFEMDHAIVTRILSLNPQIYEDIQFDNPHVPEMLDRLVDALSNLRDLVRDGGEDARTAFRRRFLHESREAYGAGVLSQGNHAFERIGYLLGDLLESPSLAVHLPDDGAGSLRALLEVFERHGVSLSSIHSSRTPAGEVHFRFGFDADQNRAALDAAARDIETTGLGRLIV